MAGGDGSVAAAAAVALEHGLPLAVIPAGTLNHFARDVGLETPQDAADAVVSGQAVRVDVADVNGTPFLNTSSIGAYPEMVRRRDRAVRPDGQVAGADRRRGPGAAHARRRCELVVNGRPLSVWILFVGNCVYTPRGLSPAWRPRLEDGLLDVQYLRADLRFGRTRAVLATLLGVSEHSRSYGHFERRGGRRCVCPVGAAAGGLRRRDGREGHRVPLPQAAVAHRLLLPDRLTVDPRFRGVSRVRSPAEPRVREQHPQRRSAGSSAPSPGAAAR